MPFKLAKAAATDACESADKEGGAMAAAAVVVDINVAAVVEGGCRISCSLISASYASSSLTRSSMALSTPSGNQYSAHAHSVFPSAYLGSPVVSGTAFGVSFPDDNRNGPSGLGWGVMILPYLEQSSLYQQFDPTVPLWAPQQTVAMRSKVTAFLCPSAVGGSDGFALRRYTSGDNESPGNPQPYSPALTLAHSHYVTMAGTQGPWARPTAWSTDFSVPEPIPSAGAAIIDGAFYRNSRIRMADITDGMSNTIFIGEHTSRLSDKTWVGVVPYSVTCKKKNGVVTDDCDSGGALVQGHSGPDLHDHPQVIIHQPNHPAQHPDQLESDHVGGCHCLLGDGSVRFFSQYMDGFTWAGLCTRAGGEVTGEF